MINSATGQHFGEAEGNEIVLASGVTKSPVLRAHASRLNVLGGGRKFVDGGPLNPLSPSDIPNPTDTVDQTQETQEENTEQNATQTALLQRIAVAIENYPTLLKAFVMISEFENAQQEVSDAEASSNV